MKTTIIPDNISTKTGQPKSLLHKLACKLILNSMANIKHGQITIHDGNESVSYGQISDTCDLTVSLNIVHPDFYTDVVLSGTIGAGEAYMKGHWTCSNLTHLTRIMVINRDFMNNMDNSVIRLSKPFCRLFHKLNRNSKTGSSRNIQAHYDLGNEFFELMLDETMMYSSAIYPQETSTLEEASVYKLDVICRKLELRPDEHLLEIGTGWGGLAIHAAKKYGCRITTTTISKKQYSLAKQRVEDAGLSDRIEVVMQDYRDLNGQYDKLVTVEMIEAVGHEHFDTFFKKCNSLLKPQGLMLLQTIIIADQFYEQAKRSVDFIQRYIFPGGCLPSVNVINNSAAKMTDFRLHHMDEFGEHYARTLRDWHKRLEQKLEQVSTLGYPDTFIRMWEYYLSYCEGGFLERSIGVTQMLFAKPLNRRKPLLMTTPQLTD